LSQIPQKERYKVSEVCEYTDTQPYVLRFWESEFPQLSPNKGRSGQSIYSREELDLVLRIKQLLNEEEHTLDGARRRLERENGGVPAAKSSADTRGSKRPHRGRGGLAGPATRTEQAPPAPVLRGPTGQEPLAFDAVSRERYDSAVEEIGHLRFKVSELEANCQRAEGALGEARQDLARLRERSSRAISLVEDLIRRLT